MQQVVEQAWEDRANLSNDQDLENVIDQVIADLDCGKLRVAEKLNNQWVVNQWVKKAILLSFKIKGNEVIDFGGGNVCYDKVPLKCANWSEQDFQAAGFRLVPGAMVRKSAFIEKNAVIMPSYINVGAYVGEGTLIDTWATVGSCAQIGKNCHISGGAGIGGVLEPIQANPVIIEDNVFIGARSEVAEGVIVEEGAVLSMGVYLGSSTRIYDRETGQVHYGRVPAYSVVVPGTMPSSDGKTQLYAAIIVKKVDAQTRSKTAINELLRND